MQEYNFNGYNQNPYEDGHKKSQAWKYIVLAVVMLALGVALALVFINGGNPGALSPVADATATPAPVQEPDESQSADDAVTPTREVPTLGADSSEYVNPLNPVADIYDNVSPSVVGVVVTKQKTMPSGGDGGSYFGYGGFSINGWNFGNSGAGAQEQTYEYKASASGVVLTKDGYIITNHHVIDDATKISVIISSSGEEVEAKLIGSDATTDLAVIKVDRTDLKPTAIGDSSGIRYGELAVVIGNPSSSAVGTITQGVISAVDRELKVDGNYNNYIQTDAAINPGNSGGALLNSSGELIGIITLKTVVAGYDENGTEIAAEGIGFAIPVNRAIGIAQQLIATGKVFRPGIGITAHQITAEEAEYNQCPLGILVYEITSGSSAEKAGLQQGDVITSVDGVEITELQSLLDMIAAKGEGDTLAMHIWRAGTEMDVTVTVGNLNDFSEA